MDGDPVDALLMSLVENEIPAGRKALLESHDNLAELSEYCKQNYVNSEKKTEVFRETKEFAAQSLASVAYQIHSLAVNVLQMMDQQSIQIQSLHSNASNISLFVDIHEEKVARRAIGNLTVDNKKTRVEKMVAPAEPRKVKKYVREEIDFSSLDHIGHGVRWDRRDEMDSDQRFSSSSGGSTKETSPSITQYSSQASVQTGSLYGSNSIDRRAASGSTMTHRPPVAPVAPFKIKATASPSSSPISSPTTFPVSPPPPPGPSTDQSADTALRNPAAPRVALPAAPPVALPAAPPMASPAALPEALIKEFVQYNRRSVKSNVPIPLPPPSTPLTPSATRTESVCAGEPPYAVPVSSTPPPPPAHQEHTYDVIPPHATPLTSPREPDVGTKVKGSHFPSAPLPPQVDVSYRAGASNLPAIDVDEPLPVLDTPLYELPPPLFVDQVADTEAQNIFEAIAPPASPLVKIGHVTSPLNYEEKVVAIYDYVPDRDDELGLTEGDVVCVIKKNVDGWFEGIKDGIQGLFPGNYVTPYM